MSLSGGGGGVQPAACKRGLHALTRIPIFLFRGCRCPNPLQMDDVWAHSLTRRIIMTGLFAERESERETERKREGGTVRT